MDILKGIMKFVMDILETVVFIGSLFMVIYLFVIQPNKIDGASMQPTFHTNEYIFTSKITYKLRPIHRGDVIVIHSPQNYEVEYIKRVIGLPGDTIRISDGEVYVNDVLIQEDYIAAKTPLWGERGQVQENIPFLVPEKNVFIMGDNRPNSADSREFGAIPIPSIIGQVVYRYFPFTKMGAIPNPWPDSRRTEKNFSYLPYVDKSFNTLFKT